MKSVVGLAEMVGIGVVELASTETGHGQIGAVGTEVAAGDGIDIDEVAEGGRAAEEGNLRALGGDGDKRAERAEQRAGPGAGHEAYRLGLVEAAGGVHHANRAGGAGAHGGDGCIELKACVGAAGIALNLTGLWLS